jgi:hypothetical protein
MRKIYVSLVFILLSAAVSAVLTPCPQFGNACGDCSGLDEDSCEDSFWKNDGSCYLCAWDGEQCVQSTQTQCGCPEPGSEICTDEKDNDCDGFIDCDDSDCIEHPNCMSTTTTTTTSTTETTSTTIPEFETDCDDDIDNDLDQLVDCDDSDCFNDPACQETTTTTETTCTTSTTETTSTTTSSTTSTTTETTSTTSSTPSVPEFSTGSVILIALIGFAVIFFLTKRK